MAKDADYRSRVATGLTQLADLYAMVGGTVLGETDDYCYNIVSDPVHIHDLQATILNRLGVDHKRLTYKFQGRHFRLTDVSGEVVKKLLA